MRATTILSLTLLLIAPTAQALPLFGDACVNGVNEPDFVCVQRSSSYGGTNKVEYLCVQGSCVAYQTRVSQATPGYSHEHASTCVATYCILDSHEESSTWGESEHNCVAYICLQERETNSTLYAGHDCWQDFSGVTFLGVNAGGGNTCGDGYNESGVFVESYYEAYAEVRYSNVSNDDGQNETHLGVHQVNRNYDAGLRQSANGCEVYTYNQQTGNENRFACPADLAVPPAPAAPCDGWGRIIFPTLANEQNTCVNYLL